MITEGEVEMLEPSPNTVGRPWPRPRVYRFPPCRRSPVRPSTVYDAPNKESGHGAPF